MKAKYVHRRFFRGCGVCFPSLNFSGKMVRLKIARQTRSKSQFLIVRLHFCAALLRIFMKSIANESSNCIRRFLCACSKGFSNEWRRHSLQECLFAQKNRVCCNGNQLEYISHQLELEKSSENGFYTYKKFVSNRVE